MIQSAEHDPAVANIHLGIDGFVSLGNAVRTPEMASRDRQSRAVLDSCLDSRDQKRHHHISADLVAGLRLVRVVHVVVLVVAVQTLRLAAGANLKRHGDAAHGLAGVRVLGLAVEVGRRLVDELGVAGADQGVNEPLLADRLAAAGEIRTAACLGRKQIALGGGEYSTTKPGI